MERPNTTLTRLGGLQESPPPATIGGSTEASCLPSSRSPLASMEAAEPCPRMLQMVQLMFVFVPTIGERNPLRGHEVGEGRVFEVRSIPGNLVGVGSTPREAIESVIDLVNWTLEDEAAAPERWYREAWAYADPGDEAMFRRTVFRQYRQAKNPRRISDRAAYDLVPA